jgi:O-antigen ligase
MQVAAGPFRIPSQPILQFARICFALLIVSLAFARPALRIAGLWTAPTDFFFLLTAGAWAAALLRRETRFRWHPIFWLLALYLAAMLLSGLFSTQPRVSAVKLATQVYLLTLPVLAYNLVETVSDLRRMLRFWLAASAIVAAICIITLFLWTIGRGELFLRETLTFTGTLPPGDYPRVALTFRLPAMLCNYLTASLGILLACRRVGWIGRGPFALLFAGICLAAFLSLTPGLGGAALLIGAWYWLSAQGRHPWRARAGLAAGIAASLLFVLVASVTPFLHPMAPFLIHLPGGITLAPAARLMFWMEAWANFLDRPLLGSGVGTDAIAVRYQYANGKIDTLTDAHNVFLNIAATCGIAGLAALAALLQSAWRRTMPMRCERGGANIVRLGLGLAFLDCFVYQGLTGSYEDARHLWVLLGLFLVAERLEKGISPAEAAAT